MLGAAISSFFLVPKLQLGNAHSMSSLARVSHQPSVELE